MLLISFLFLFINFGLSEESGGDVVKPSTPDSISYFIGQGDELSQCNQAKTDIANDINKCKDYEDLYNLRCSGDSVTLYCEENDEKFSEITTDTFLIYVIIGSNPPTVDLSKLPELRIWITPLMTNVLVDNEIIGKQPVSLKGCEVKADIVMLQLLQIKILDSNLTFKSASLSSSAFEESEFYMISGVLNVDYDFLDQSNFYDKKIIASTIDVYLGDSYLLDNLSITFTENHWLIAGKIKGEISYSKEIPYSFTDLLKITANEKIATFIVNDPSTAVLKSVGISYQEGGDVTLYSAGKWEEPLKGPLNVYLANEDDVITNVFYYSENFHRNYFNFDVEVKEPQVITTPKPDKPTEIPVTNQPTEEPDERKGYYIFIGTGIELDECRTAKQEIEKDANKCNDYSDKYLIQCDEDFVFLCEENDNEFVNAKPSSIIILSGTNSPSINLSKLPYVDLIVVIPLGGYIDPENNNAYLTPTKTVSLKGCNITSNIMVVSLKINIVESDFYVSDMASLHNCEIIESEFRFHINVFTGNDYTISHLPENSQEIANIFRIFGQFYNIIITFTENKWNVTGYEKGNDDSYTKYDNLISYKIAKSLYIQYAYDNITFNIDDPALAKLKGVEISTISPKLTLIQSGKWTTPLVGPLNVYLHNEYATYDVESLDKEWFRFNIDELNPDLPSSDVITSSNDDGNDQDNSSPGVISSNNGGNDQDNSPPGVISSNDDGNDQDNSSPDVISSNNGGNDQDNSPPGVISSNDDGDDNNKSPEVSTDENVQYTSNFETIPDNSSIATKRPVPTTVPPILINDTSKKDNVVIDTIKNINDITNADTIKETIETKFNETKPPSDDNPVDQVIKIETSSTNTVEFKNLSLKPNQYIKLGDNANVKLTDGQLNLVLDEESKSVSVTVEKTNEVKLSIKNMEECTVELKAPGTEKSNVKITSNSEVYGPLNFEVSSNVEAIEIESINLHDSGSISSKVPISIKNIEAKPQTTGKLKNVAVSEEFSISQSSVLELDDCSLSAAKLNLNLHTYTSSNYDTPMLNGTLGDPPASISLNKPDDNSAPPPANVEFLLFRGKFKPSCDEWKKKIDYGLTHFDDAVCRDISSLTFLEDDKSLSVFDNPNNGKGDGGKEDSGKKLTGGQIAGIVVGCIAGVAIIVVVVVIIIKKKKNQESSAESDGEQQVDL